MSSKNVVLFNWFCFWTVDLSGAETTKSCQHSKHAYWGYMIIKKFIICTVIRVWKYEKKVIRVRGGGDN